MDILLFVDPGLEFPQMYEHIDKLEQYLQFPITRLKPPHTFEYLFYEYVPRRKNPALEGVPGLSWPGPQCGGVPQGSSHASSTAICGS